MDNHRTILMTAQVPFRPGKACRMVKTFAGCIGFFLPGEHLHLTLFIPLPDVCEEIKVK
jgi:hypothetical protein